ncbi:MAG: sigma 54-interacting transcriptional regulator [Deltaproteobacteria bacterium]|nr:sigma 54-interacting transcriptional regulator [Deltaproteobacteria bacterium]MBW1948875.1 sigma 54-interacting transcriptional regulator [Deltaproteobacteria bacterium]MBW2006722.1 sigma 54-interacting transcriptional regulator [Deltaproteobacteria bacterium]
MNPEDRESIPLPEHLLGRWQGFLEWSAQAADVPVTLVRRLNGAFLETCCTHELGPPFYDKGARLPLAGSFCEGLFRPEPPEAVATPEASASEGPFPDLAPGMNGFLAVPIRWPDGDVFGALCALHPSPDHFDEHTKALFSALGAALEAQLETQYQAHKAQKRLEYVLDNLAEGILVHDRDRKILFFNRHAEKITGYKRDQVVGRDCHEAFGAPFCGGRCSFMEGPPEALQNLNYPLNIITRGGEPRRLEMSVSEVDTGSEGSLGVIASFRDVTDLIGLKLRLGEVKRFAGIVGQHPRMLQIYAQIRELATHDYPVCITGETGTGKELVAAAIHSESRRGGGPFVPVNCAALPEGMLESELFGHVRGAFTGAVRDKRGRFELAHGGTLFLDEVGELPRVLQAKLLRVLQEKTFERVGGEKTVRVDVRVISATNRNLKREVEKGRFREDLFYRLNVVPIHVPPLRRRKADIPLLLEHFLQEVGNEGKDTLGLSKPALSLMMDYPWPGNVRELQSALRYALVKSRGGLIEPEHLPPELISWKEQRPGAGPPRKLDEESVRTALARTGGNKAKAARLLGVGRATLYRFLKDFESVS